MSGHREDREPSCHRPDASLFPAGVVALIEPIDAIVGAVYPEEENEVASAAPKRRREFLAGRRLSRRALEELNFPAGAIPRRPDRSPAWPPGVVGSISHSTFLCGAAVARRGPILGIGLDVEEGRALPAAAWADVFTHGETTALSRVDPRHRQRRALLLFSAKESVFKCVQGVLPGWLDFVAVEISLDPRSRCFSAALVSGGSRTCSELIGRIDGRFRLGQRCIFTGATVSEPSLTCVAAVMPR
jgi:4'-phosphopantetheinyl transferase EntD